MFNISPTPNRTVASRASLPQVRMRLVLNQKDTHAPQTMSDDLSAAEPSACRNIAVLFDADNAQPTRSAAVLAEVSRFGVAVVRRAYGDWTEPNMASWKPVILAEAILPMQQFRFTAGKNATDCAMIIDAMDLLHSGRFQAFALVSSDSDFSGLARRIREDGLIVLGFGRSSTAASFVAACDHFVFTEDLQDKLRAARAPVTRGSDLRNYDELLDIVANAVASCCDGSGWAHLGPLGTTIAAMLPGFDPRHWGAKKLSLLLADMPEIEMRWHRHAHGAPPTPFVRLRTG